MITADRELTGAEKEELLKDFKNEPPCETNYPPCAEPVSWLEILYCCKGKRKLICDKHKRRYEEFVRGATYVLCAHCTHQIDHEFIPI